MGINLRPHPEAVALTSPVLGAAQRPEVERREIRNKADRTPSLHTDGEAFVHASLFRRED